MPVFTYSSRGTSISVLFFTLTFSFSSSVLMPSSEIFSASFFAFSRIFFFFCSSSFSFTVDSASAFFSSSLSSGFSSFNFLSLKFFRCLLPRILKNQPEIQMPNQLICFLLFPRSCARKPVLYYFSLLIYRLHLLQSASQSGSALQL